MSALTPLEQWSQQVDAIVARFATPHTYSCDTCHDAGYVYDSGAEYGTRDDDKPCPDCRHIGYESSPYGPDGDWGPES